MIKLEKTSVMNMENAIRGARNPLNSWARMDSYYDENGEFHLGEADIVFGAKLCRAGSDHRKFIRQIFVSVDILAPLYWWKEFDTYKVGTVINGCSTMHKIHAKEFTLDDFSHEHLIDITKPTKELIDSDCVPFEESGARDTLYWTATNILELTIEALNTYRQRYLETNDKKYWWQMIQLLPTSYNQKRTVMLNYEVLANIYKSRKNHKLTEWHTLCDWIERLPYSELITGGKDA